MRSWIGVLAWLTLTSGGFSEPQREVAIFFTGQVRGNFGPCG